MEVAFVEDRFAAVVEVMKPIADAFARAGHELYLVGGAVRDLALTAVLSADIDCTTSARPETIKSLLEPFSSALWTKGERFGTIGAAVGSHSVEITTFRAEHYHVDSRKPEVEFGDDLETDLSRRDFTINAMAVSLLDGTLLDPFGGATDLADRRLRTPLDPEISFGDDPLRMLRAARFIPRFGLRPDSALVGAAVALAHRLAIVSRERIHDEIEGLLAVESPESGLEFLFDCGLATPILGFEPDPTTRRRALEGAATALGLRRRRMAFLAPFGVSTAASVLENFRYSNVDRAETALGLRVIDELPDRPATAPGVRRLVVDLGGSIELARDVLAVAALDELRHAHAEVLRARFEELAGAGDLDDLGPVLDGETVMEVLGLEPGPAVGRALAHLRERRLDRGPMTREEAIRELHRIESGAPRPSDPAGAG
jgi:poly(A) polymerase